MFKYLQNVPTSVTGTSNLMCVKLNRCSHPKPLSMISILQLMAQFCLRQKHRDYYWLFFPLYSTYYLSGKYPASTFEIYMEHVEGEKFLTFYTTPCWTVIISSLDYCYCFLTDFPVLSLPLHSLFLIQGDILKT